MNPSPSRRILIPASWHLSTALLLALGSQSHAGDILRGGGTPSAPARSAGGNEAGAVQAATARANAQDALARTSQALAAVQQFQLQARAAATAQNNAGAGLPVVPNGLGADGLQPATNATLWTGANLPVQRPGPDNPSRVEVKVTQTAQQALLHWDSFNVGRQTDLVFDQSAGGASKSQWIAFNTVNDPSGVPSQILGSIKADGQVYVINQNGIIFGGASEVNTHTLVASSLPLNENLVSRGLLNNPDSQFLFSSLAQPAGRNGTPAVTPAASTAPNGRIGDVTVQAGARLLSPTSADKVGGRIALVGPNVSNAGTIGTPDGQTILAAGLQVGILAHNTNDPTLRGLDVYVGAVTDPASVIPSYAGAAVNSGLISALRASVTITGREVTNAGAIDSSTSVSLNGRIDLKAHYDAVSVNGVDSQVPFLFRESGTVTLDTGSMARIMPEYASAEKAVGTRLALTSQVNLESKAVHMAANSSLVAPNASINLNAGTWAYFPGDIPPASRFLQRDGQIYLDSGAILSAAGSSDVQVPASQNFVTAELRSSELADSPLLRNSPLRGQKVVVDIRQTGTYNGRTWVGSPIADVSGYAGLVERGAGELTVSGGTVKMSAGSSVVMQPGARVDVSDGWINYTGASLAATRLLSNGDILDISQATPDRIYDGIFTGNAVSFYEQWGLTSTWVNPLAPTGRRYEPGGLFGAAAGSLTITAPSMALDGGLYGITVAGPGQRTLLPKISELTLNFQREEFAAPHFAESPTPPAVTIGSAAPLPAAGAFGLDAAGNVIPLATERLTNVTLAPDLMTTAGFGSLRVNNGDGNIVVPAGVNLTAPNQGSIALTGANVIVAGNITSAGGTINLTAYTVSPFEAAKFNSTSSKPAPGAGRGTVSLASGSTLSTAGLRVDDRLFADDPLGSQLVVNAGSININAYHTLLTGGSALDVSGGVSVSPSARLTYGTGGAISLKGSQDPNVDAVTGGTMQPGSTLSGFSGGRGGTLAVTAPAIQVGGSAAPAGVLHLDPSFFSTGGFTGYTMTGPGLATGTEGQFVPGIFITPGTQINPAAQNWLALTYGTSGGLDLTQILQQEGVRTPVSVSFNAPGVRDIFNSGRQQVRGDLILGEGAAIKTDARATVSLRGDSVSFPGSVIAPGGTINLSSGTNSQTVFEGAGARTDVALTTMHLGPQSVLSTAGKLVLTPDPRDFRTGTVHAGGTITVAGNIAAEQGAIIDVSGTSGELDVAPGFLGSSYTENNTLQGSERVRTRVDSAAGTINLTGGQQLYVDATLRGNAGGPGVQGGTLNLSSGRFAIGPVPNALFPTVRVAQSELTIPSMVTLGQPITAAGGTALQGMGYFTADQFNRSGLGALTLAGTVQFSGAVNLNAARTMSVATSGVIFADSDVSLTAAHVALGQRFVAPKLAEERVSYTPFTDGNLPLFIQPATGAGTLTVHARHIDIGNLTLQGIVSAHLFADNGDIRGNGTFDIAGRLHLRAGQIFPATASTFTISASDYQTGGATQQGTVNITGSGARRLPLSAGGELNIFAGVIEQGGALRAPAGTINLGWDGTGTAAKDPVTNQPVALTTLTVSAGGITSVSSLDPVTGAPVTLPYGTNLSGTAWIDPSGTDITRIGPPTKGVNLSGQNVDVQAGSSLDIRGGGELHAYRWVPGNGGTRDILASSSGFAVIPNYESSFAPYAAFNPGTLATNLNGDSGYVNTTLNPGDRVWLNASEGLPAGSYTLLPARYALLPGAFLVTPKTGTPGGTVVQPDKSSLVAGYRFNDANAGGQNVLMSNFEVAPVTVVRQRAQYDNFTATAFFREVAANSGTTAPRLPMDGGQLVLTAAQNLAFGGSLTALAPAGGRGGLVDISSPLDILIAGPDVTGNAGTLTLRSADLSSFNAQSLLIGGVRRTAAGGTTISVKTGSLTVDNAGAPLTGSDIILVSNGSLTITGGSSIVQSGTSAAESLLFGEATQAGSGNGTLLRLSGDANARVTRRGITAANGPNLSVAAGAELRGTSLTLDSTASTMLDATARLRSSAINLNSGRISLALDNAGALPSDAGLVLTGAALDDLQTAQTLSSLSFLSYSSIDIYGIGEVGSATARNLELHAAEIRGFNNAGGRVAFAAQNILVDNSAAGAVPGAASPACGTLAFEGDVIRLGANNVRVDQFSLMELTAAGGIVVQGTGSLTASNSAILRTPLLTAGSAADQAIRASGALEIAALAGTPAIASGLGARLQLSGESVTNSARILLSSGHLTMQAGSGDVAAGGVLDVSGTAQQFFDLTKFTDGGSITLASASGDVAVPAGAQLSVKAQPGGGSAGTLTVSATGGTVNIEGSLDGAAGSGGRSGSTAITARSLAALAGLDALLNAAHFIEGRSYRALTGDVAVNGPAKAINYSVSADQGSVTVSDMIDASGDTGGDISIHATGGVTLSPTARLSAAAVNFDAAGKGGSIEIEAGAPRNGTINTAAMLDIQSGATINLAVAANNAGSTAAGQFEGTLHLRAPQTASGTELQMNPISGGITGASSIVVEGYKLFGLAGSGTIDTTVQNNVRTNATAFGNAGPDIRNRLLSGPNAALQSITAVQPGAEIFNLNGDLTLAATWDLSTFRFGPQNLPGVLTMRASGNLNFDFTRSLSDGFGGGAGQLWQQPLLAAGDRSWSYRLTAGADLSAAGYRAVQPLPALPADKGSFILGSNGTGTMTLPTAFVNVIRDGIITPRYQTIRTGTGDIIVTAGRDVQILNPLGTIYTAGTQAAPMANFDQPDVSYAANTQSPLGIAQSSASNPYPAQYSLAGGNVTIMAQNDIARYRRDALGLLVPDSTREMPTNWLYRRGYVDPATSEFAATRSGRDAGSTSWWVDFSNFYEGVGALGGGNVTMTAGRDVANVDAVIPTNARMPKGTPDAGALLELGGGELTVTAGRDLDGGVYYVERGTGSIAAGRSIKTNSTRAAMSQGQVATLQFQNKTPDATSWLPTTLFAGKATFDVTAGSSVLLGQVANPFLLPQGINNSYHQKTYFSTYSQSAAVNVSALTGDVTLQSNPSGESPGTLFAWYFNVLRFSTLDEPYSRAQPWLRLAETDITPFATATALMPGTLRATAFSGDINLAGNLTLSPAASGTIDFAAAGDINGLQRNSIESLTGSYQWGTSTINLSDADPVLLPRIAAPLTLAGQSVGNAWLRTPVNALDTFNTRFLESGSTTGNYAVLQTRQALHAAGILHAEDTIPLRMYAGSGSISGLTLFSGKPGRLFAGADLTDISLYVQNVRGTDITVVSSGRDIVAYNPNALLRTQAQTAGNVLLATPAGLPTAGDLQIGGPGTIEVLAGRHLDLGVGPNNPDRTALGLVSIGNARNPALPFEGADIVAAAGLGAAGGLTNPNMDFAAFIQKYVTASTMIGADEHFYLAETLGGKSYADFKKLTAEEQQALVARTGEEFNALSEDQQRLEAINIFYKILRDTGRARGKTGNYEAGETAIKTLFKGDSWKGDIALTSREIKTQSGGNISLLAPGGKLTVGLDASGNQALDQGIFTESGGTISIFAHESVAVGTSRIFTLRGGDEMIWSSIGDIAAGASSKTVQSAPPTRVLIDPQSGDVKTDLAGLATGGGIGVLATVAGVAAGNVDLIAPKGTIDAGDAGIRVTGNINISAHNVVNAGNIAAGGSSVGTPAAPSSGGATTSTPPPATQPKNEGAGSMDDKNKPAPPPPAAADPLSVITAEVLGYGGSSSEEDEEEKKRRKKKQEEEAARKANEGTR